MLVLQLTRQPPASSGDLETSYSLLVLDEGHEDNYFVAFKAPYDLLDASHQPADLGRLEAWLCNVVLEERADGQEKPATCLSEALEYGDQVILRLAPDQASGLQGADVDWEHMGLMEEHADMKEMFDSEWHLGQTLPPASPPPARLKF